MNDLLSVLKVGPKGLRSIHTFNSSPYGTVAGAKLLWPVYTLTHSLAVREVLMTWEC